MPIKDSGITLVDIIITITILGILLSVAVPNLVKAVERSEFVAKEMNSKLLLSIIQSYNAEQMDKTNQIREITISHIDDIPIETVQQRIPTDFDWDMLYPIYIDNDGRGSIQYEE